MTQRMFSLDGPVTAVDLGGSRHVQVCPVCGAAKSMQVRPLTVRLLSATRSVWVTDSGALLLRGGAATGFVDPEWKIELVEVQVRPGEEVAAPPNDVVQLQPTRALEATPDCVEFEECSCGSVRELNVDSLAVRPVDGEGIWLLLENPRMVLVSAGVRHALGIIEPDLEFIGVEERA